MKLFLIWTYAAKELKGYNLKQLRKELKQTTAIAKYEKRLKAEIKKRGKQ